MNNNGVLQNKIYRHSEFISESLNAIKIRFRIKFGMTYCVYILHIAEV